MAVHSGPLPRLPWNGQEKHGAFHPARCQPKGLAWLENLARCSWHKIYEVTRQDLPPTIEGCVREFLQESEACMRAFRGDKSQGHI